MSVSVVDAQGVETALALRTACPEFAVAATLTPASFGAYLHVDGALKEPGRRLLDS